MNKRLLTYFFVLVISVPAFAQMLGNNNSKKNILSGLGIAGGITYGKQVWNPEGPLAQERYILRGNFAVLAEFFHHPVYRWRTELEYNLMGTGELLYYSNPAVTYRNKTNYISFNNYLKINFRNTGFIPYFLIGPRVEYLLIRKAQIYPDVISQLHTIQITGAIGVGAEINWNSPLRPFIEAFYNHDLLYSYDNYYNGLYTSIGYRAYELRVGLKYFFEGIKKDVCPKVYNPAGN